MSQSTVNPVPPQQPTQQQRRQQQNPQPNRRSGVPLWMFAVPFAIILVVLGGVFLFGRDETPAPQAATPPTITNQSGG